MDPDGTVGSTAEISDTSGQLSGPANPGGILSSLDGFGTSVAAIGDVDFNGVEDLAVGAPGDDDGAGINNAGAVYILFMETDGTLVDAAPFTKISDVSGQLSGPANPGGILGDGDAFGTSVAKMGDLDGNVVRDLAVGTPGDDDGAISAGAVYILFLDFDGTLDNTTPFKKISDTSGQLSGPANPGGILSGSPPRFGTSVASIGDIDGDSVPDLAVGAPFDPAGQFGAAGAVYILFMDPDETLDDTTPFTKISDTSGQLSGPANPGNLMQVFDQFGASVLGIGDFNADNIFDIAVGAPGDDDGGTEATGVEMEGDDLGAFYILFMDSDGTVDDTTPFQKISDTAGGFSGPANPGGILAAGDIFGSAIGGFSDLDNDGVDDLTVGVPRADDGGNTRGEVYVLFMAPTTPTTGTLTIVKNTVGGTDGDSFDFDIGFTGGPNAGAPNIVTASGTGTTAALDVAPGIYSVKETIPADWKITSASCGGGTFDTIDNVTGLVIGAGDNVVCTFENTKDAKLIITKNLPNDNGGDGVASEWQIDITATNPSQNNFPASLSSIAVVVDPGAYSVDESLGKAGYTKLLSAGCSGTITAGQVKTCNIINDDIAPRITLHKNVTNNDGGNEGVIAFDLTLDFPIAGSIVPQGGAGVDVNATTLIAIGEDLAPGYQFVSITGDAKCPGALGGTVTLDEGEKLTCTINNDDIAPTITLIKNVITDDNGNEGPNDFGISVNGTGVTSGVAETVDSNLAFPINEVGFTGYSFVDITGNAKCPGALGGDVAALDEGENITCTITNDDIAPLLTVTKVLVNNFGDAVVPDDFALTANGTAVLSGVQNPFAANDAMAIDETLVAGYEFLSFAGDCPAALGGTITMDEGDVKSCTITNRGIGTIKIIKNSIGGIGTFDFDIEDGRFFLGPSSPIAEQLMTVGPVETGPFTKMGIVHNVIAGQYNVTESLVTDVDSWTLNSIDCGTDEVQEDIGNKRVVIDVNPGDNVVCTFENQDTKVPAVTVPADFRVEDDGATVSDAFSPLSTADDVDPTPSAPACSVVLGPTAVASPNDIPTNGTHTVTCESTDLAGNTGSSQFDVTLMELAIHTLDASFKFDHTVFDGKGNVTGAIGTDTVDIVINPGVGETLLTNVPITGADIDMDGRWAFTSQTLPSGFIGANTIEVRLIAANPGVVATSGANDPEGFTVDPHDTEITLLDPNPNVIPDTSWDGVVKLQVQIKDKDKQTGGTGNLDTTQKTIRVNGFGVSGDQDFLTITKDYGIITFADDNEFAETGDLGDDDSDTKFNEDPQDGATTDEDLDTFFDEDPGIEVRAAGHTSTGTYDDNENAGDLVDGPGVRIQALLDNEGGAGDDLLYNSPTPILLAMTIKPHDVIMDILNGPLNLDSSVAFDNTFGANLQYRDTTAPLLISDILPFVTTGDLDTTVREFKFSGEGLALGTTAQGGVTQSQFTLTADDGGTPEDETPTDVTSQTGVQQIQVNGFDFVADTLPDDLLEINITAIGFDIDTEYNVPVNITQLLKIDPHSLTVVTQPCTSIDPETGEAWDADVLWDFRTCLETIVTDLLFVGEFDPAAIKDFDTGDLGDQTEHEICYSDKGVAGENVQCFELDPVQALPADDTGVTTTGEQLVQSGIADDSGDARNVITIFDLSGAVLGYGNSPTPNTSQFELNLNPHFTSLPLRPFSASVEENQFTAIVQLTDLNRTFSNSPEVLVEGFFDTGSDSFAKIASSTLENQ